MKLSKKWLYIIYVIIAMMIILTMVVTLIPGTG